MARVKFHLKRGHSLAPTSITAVLRINGETVKVYTGQSVLPDDWNPRKQRVRETTKTGKVINRALDSVEANLLLALEELRTERASITAATIRERYDALTGNAGSPADRIGLADLLEAMAVAKHWTASTKTTKDAAFAHFRAFMERERLPLTPEACTFATLSRLVVWLVGRDGVSNAYARYIIATIRALLSWSFDQGHHKEDGFRRITHAAIPTGRTEQVRLASAEVEAIARLDLSHSPRMENVRRLFLLQCSTGLRHSDLSALVREHAGRPVRGETLALTTQKNRKAITIPVTDAVRALLESQPRLRAVSNDAYNSNLKRIGELAGLTDTVTRVTYKGSTRIEQRKRKCDLLASHAAKRTFVSVMVERGATLELVMALTGNTLSSMATYVNVSTEAAANTRRTLGDLYDLGSEGKGDG